MKLFYFANIRLPTEKAHGIQIMKTCEALSKQGIKVELITPKRRNHIKDEPFAFYGVKKNFDITKLWCWDLITRNILGALGFWIESWTFFYSVKKYLSGQAGAIYYTRDLSVAYWMAKEFKPVYYEIHTLPDVINSRYIEAWRRSKGLIVISDGLKQELMRQGIAPEKILVARDAVDLEKFKILESRDECREKLNLPRDKKIIVYTGHLYGWKGAAILAEATKYLSPEIQVYIVGGTAEDVEKFRKTYDYPNLHIAGLYPHDSMPLWQRAADILVIPTSAKEKIGANYTSPMKLFEYMMAEKPIVGSDIASLREVLDNTTAFFFKPDEPSSLAITVQEVLKNYSEAKNKATKARYLAMEEYSWDKRAKKIFDLIKKDL